MNNDDYLEENYHFEDWEIECHLINNKNHDKLIDFRKKFAEKYPRDLHAQHSLCDAYNLNKEYYNALNKLTQLYQESPDMTSTAYLVLETLYNLGKDENDFNWITKPKVLLDNVETADICYNLLKGKRKPRAIYDIHTDLYGYGYTKFNEDDLYNLLKNDSRFIVKKDDSPELSEVKRKPRR
ncbi:MAG: hypothetical protein COA82_07950 [Alkaliphilus sp.]|nr:hypothetical protein [bacterium AH-315-L21]MBN4067890.1 hypothetical protein [Alkaliphilus transvaalensis]PHS33914.1 MAG: hypothetical protein COA82_07950 [Alkaliphilus sp.]